MVVFGSCFSFYIQPPWSSATLYICLIPLIFWRGGMRDWDAEHEPTPLSSKPPMVRQGAQKVKIVVKIH